MLLQPCCVPRATLLHRQVLSVTLATIAEAEAFKAGFAKYEFLWSRDLNAALQVGSRARAVWRAPHHPVVTACMACIAQPAHLHAAAAAVGVALLPRRLLHHRHRPFTCRLCCPQDFLEAEGVRLPDGSRDDPPLAKFEEQITKYQ